MITAVGRITFNPGLLLRPMDAELRRRTVRAAYALQGRLRKKVGRPGNAMNKRARERDGVIRSKPGEPPMKQTGFGQRSITVKFGRGQLSAQIGIFEKATYMVYNEFGVHKGNYNLEERPWLRPTLAEMRGEIIAILNGTAP